MDLYVDSGTLGAQGSAMAGLGGDMASHGSGMGSALQSALGASGDPALAGALSELIGTVSTATLLAQLALQSVGRAVVSASQTYSGTDGRLAGQFHAR